ALDYRTDKNIRATLKENSNQITSIIVAQRIGTIKNCDKIIVIDNGEIVGIGKHEELLKDNEVYKEIALSQLSKEELDG
ncbi:MAG: ABC transporter ATP-binding protein, partial [Clostridia bacterium]|nr:ABC transporter ATP-binding protein [Clostridia bacterium]